MRAVNSVIPTQTMYFNTSTLVSMHTFYDWGVYMALSPRHSPLAIECR